MCVLGRRSAGKSGLLLHLFRRKYECAQSVLDLPTQYLNLFSVSAEKQDDALAVLDTPGYDDDQGDVYWDGSPCNPWSELIEPMLYSERPKLAILVVPVTIEAAALLRCGSLEAPRFLSREDIRCIEFLARYGIDYCVALTFKERLLLDSKLEGFAYGRMYDACARLAAELPRPRDLYPVTMFYEDSISLALQSRIFDCAAKWQLRLSQLPQVDSNQIRAFAEIEHSGGGSAREVHEIKELSALGTASPDPYLSRVPRRMVDPTCARVFLRQYNQSLLRPYGTNLNYTKLVPKNARTKDVEDLVQLPDDDAVIAKSMIENAYNVCYGLLGRAAFKQSVREAAALPLASHGVLPKEASAIFAKILELDSESS